jgi:2,4-dienoyl-CoA reductase-like NADH-dependent reductase (Old Yellow Enzyme family)/thioredoxin reductase
MFDALFAEIRYGNVVAKNRIMQLATNTNLDDRGSVSDAMIAFHEARARYGVGAIVSPGLAVHSSAVGSTASGRTPFDASSRAMIVGLSRLAAAVHQHDVPIFGQLVHPGRQHNSRTLPGAWGPSPLPCPHSGGVPHEMTADEIASVTAGFAASAQIMQEAGFDGVEVHGAQGHLLQEFISPYSNHRDDAYGGSFENRMRFMAEVITAIRAACDGWAVGARIAGDEWSAGGIDLRMAVDVAGYLAASAPVDYLSLSMGNFNTIEAHIPDRSHPIMAYVGYAGEIRRSVPGVPVIACGRILTPENAALVIESGQADVIGLCRPLIADEKWVAKAKAGQAKSIRKCISCNQCWDNIVSGRPVRCVHNVTAGRELELGTDVPRAAKSKRVVVVGGGPAGLEAARVAALGGHQVVLLEGAGTLGGQVALAAKAAGHHEVGYVIEHLSAELESLQVDIRLGRPASADEIAGLAPDAVIVATGSVPRRDGLPDLGTIPVLTAADAINDPAAAGHRVVILDEDGYFQACAVAEQLASQQIKVYLVTRFFEVGREIALASRTTTIRALDLLGVELMPNAWVHSADGGGLVMENYASKRRYPLPDVDSVVHIGFNKPQDDLYRSLHGRVPVIHLVGDAYMPRRILDATSQAHEAARCI